MVNLERFENLSVEDILETVDEQTLTEAIERGRRRMFVIVWYRESRCCC